MAIHLPPGFSRSVVVSPGMADPEPIELGKEYDLECPENQSPSDKGCVHNPKRIEHVEPKYWRKARRRGLETRLAFRMLLLESGRIDEITVVKSSTDYEPFRVNAEKALRKWRYEPARPDEQPVDVSFHAVVEYELK